MECQQLIMIVTIKASQTIRWKCLHSSIYSTSQVYTQSLSVMLCRQRGTRQFDFKIFNDSPHSCFSISCSLQPESEPKIIQTHQQRARILFPDVNGSLTAFHDTGSSGVRCEAEMMDDICAGLCPLCVFVVKVCFI